MNFKLITINYVKKILFHIRTDLSGTMSGFLAISFRAKIAASFFASFFFLPFADGKSTSPMYAATMNLQNFILFFKDILSKILVFFGKKINRLSVRRRLDNMLRPFEDVAPLLRVLVQLPDRIIEFVGLLKLFIDFYCQKLQSNKIP